MAVPRPSDAPARIPQWAWRLHKWLLTRPKLRHRRPRVPLPVPSWFWRWRKWKLTPPRKRAKAKAQTPLTMYDSVDVSQIPRGAHAVAGYVNGHWPTYEQLVHEFPHAQKLSIAVTSHADAETLDVERGDARPDQAPEWVKRQHARGLHRPVVYTSVSMANDVMQALAQAGIRRSQYRLWTAHYTFKPHRCGPECGFGFRDRADATQWTDRALGRNLDASQVSPEFFDL